VLGWGATFVSLRWGEYYTALERGIVDGIASMTLSVVANQPLYEVAKYIVDDPYYQSTLAIIGNLGKWNQLPPHLQKLIMEATIDWERKSIANSVDQFKEYRKQWEDGKTEFYKLAPDVAKWFLDQAYNSSWDYQQEKFPEVTQKLRKLLTKH